MRIIDSIPHPSLTISIFQMNDKFIIKFEAGPMEQVFKFRLADVGNLGGLKERIDQQFIDEVYQRFFTMKEQIGRALS